MPIVEADFYDEGALLDRLTDGVRSSDRPVVFLVGSAVSAPDISNEMGVPSVSEIVNLIRSEFTQLSQQQEFDEILQKSENKYQAAFLFLIGRRGQAGANEIIKRSVWRARKDTSIGEKGPSYLPGDSTTDEACRALDSDLEGWALPGAASALGQLVSYYPNWFGTNLITTNFDPLLEVAIKKSGGQFFRTVLHRDGNLNQTEGSGCHVIHLHGYWYGADTLHTPRQLNQPRPRLKASLGSIIKSKTGLYPVRLTSA
jgi:hypothetical protein